MGAMNWQHRVRTFTIGAIVGSVCLGVSAPVALAQRVSPPNRSNRDLDRTATESPTTRSRSRDASEPIRTIPEAFTNTFFRSNKDSIFDNSIGGQFSTVFGFPFPEVGTNADARRIRDLHREVMYLQNNADPILRTDDYPNPYNSSLLETLRTGGPDVGSGMTLQ